MPEREFNEIFSERLNFFLNKYEMTQLELSKRLGVGTTSVYNWCNGLKTPRMDKVDAMCEIFHCKRSDLMEEPKSIRASTTAYTINVLGRVAAGIPINAVEEIIDTEEITEEMAKTGEYFGLRISGHSMEPRICDGDVVIVRQQSDVYDGDIAIVLVNGSDGTCKRIKRYQDSLALLPLNPSYEPMIYSKDEVDSLPVKIIGKVVELRGKF